MYYKIITKYYLHKIFTLTLPKNTHSNITNYYFCKYLIKNTPYNNFSIFIKEIHKIINILLDKNFTKKLFFLCTDKIFLFDQQKKTNLITFINSQKSDILDLKYISKSNNIVFWYNLNYSNKLLGYIKDLKLVTIGFLDFHNQSNSTDYTLLIEGKFFSSIFLFHFILKKLLIK